MVTTASNDQMAGFHPPRITQPWRIISSARALLKLPREVVHQILDDMTVFQVLQLASCLEDATYLDECILGHLQYQHLFASQQDLTEVRDLFIVFYEIRSSLNMEHAPKQSPLAHNVRLFSPRGVRVARDYLPNFLCKDMQGILTSLDDDSLQTLNQFSDDILASIHARLNSKLQSRDCEAFYNCWSQIVTAERKINSIKADQLFRIAELFEEYPKLLKRPTDPSQMPRSNTNHIVQHIRNWAEKVKKHRWLKRKRQGKAVALFANVHFPIVPFDSCLRLFCRKVETPPNEQLDSYPQYIINDIKIVIAGVPFLYTNRIPDSNIRPKEAKVQPKKASIQPGQFPRTKFSQYSAQPWYSYDSSTQAVSEWKVVDRNLTNNDHWKPTSQNNARLLPAIVPKLEIRQAWTYTYVSTPEWPQAWESGYVPFAECASPDDCWNTTHKHPIFTCPLSAHLGSLFAQKVAPDSRVYWKRLPPHDEKESSWLRAFLRVVTYLQAAEKKDKELSQALEGKCQISDGA